MHFNEQNCHNSVSNNIQSDKAAVSSNNRQYNNSHGNISKPIDKPKVYGIISDIIVDFNRPRRH